jgi:hypothetical protein
MVIRTQMVIPTYLIAVLMMNCRVIKQELAKEAGDLQTGACRGGRPKTSKKECGGYLVIACNERGNTRG